MLPVISSHACAINASPPAGLPCVAYSHTPMRYAWLEDTDRDRLSGARGAALRLISGRLRKLDREAARFRIGQHALCLGDEDFG